METDSGIFTAPRSGRYEVTFTGLLKSYNGNRVWSTLYKVDEQDYFISTEHFGYSDTNGDWQKCHSTRLSQYVMIFNVRT